MDMDMAKGEGIAAQTEARATVALSLLKRIQDLANMADKQAARVTEIVDLHVGAEDKAAQNPDDASREGIFGQMELALDVIGRSLSEINRQMDRL